MRPKALILRGAATNCDLETAAAFSYCGAQAEIVHLNELLKGLKKISDYEIMALPGGFSYGDDISAGQIFALKLRTLKKEFEAFIKAAKPVIGICNGFQVLVKTGYLPQNAEGKRKATLFLNDCGHFVCKWVKLKVNKKSPCIFTRGLPEEIELPIACGEGKFLTCEKKELERILNSNLAPLYYAQNPNGSQKAIAGLCNEQGNILGLMPHPERTFFSVQSQKKERKNFLSVGYFFFKNAVDYCR